MLDSKTTFSFSIGSTQAYTSFETRQHTNAVCFSDLSSTDELGATETSNINRDISGGKFASPRDIRAEVTMTCLWDLVGEVMVVQLCQIT